MEDLTSSSVKVKELIALRSKLLSRLDKCEAEIADAEYQYLEETDHGNIVKGFDGFLHFRFSSQNRKARVRARERVFSRSSTSAPLPEEEDIPFQTPLASLDNLVSMINAQFDGKPAKLIMSPDDKVHVPVPQSAPTRRRKSSMDATSASVPLTPSAPVRTSTVSSEVASGPTTRRTSKRRR